MQSARECHRIPSGRPSGAVWRRRAEDRPPDVAQHRLEPRGPRYRAGGSNGSQNRYSSYNCFNPRPGGGLSHLRLGGEGVIPPRLTKKLRGLERRGKSNRKLIKNTVETISAPFFAKVKIVASRGQKCRKFRVLRDCQTSRRKTSMISETIRAKTNPKTAFERELNSSSHYWPQIWPKVNSLATRSHRSKKKLSLSEIFYRE